MNISVQRYHAGLAHDWANVLSNSKNGLFLFDRNFIEYHGDRFADLSVIAFVDGQPVGLLPAAIDTLSGRAVSHPGLTFGGVVLRRDVRGDVAITVINSVLDRLKELGASSMAIKLVPPLFTTYPAEELAYVLWRRGFTLTRRDLSSVLPLEAPLPFNTSKTQSVKKAQKAGLVVTTSSVSEFYGLLEEVLRRQHNVSPVHTHAELKLLSERFPNNIFIRAARDGEKVLAGAMVFRYQHIWHTQYLASSPEGRAQGALDLVISSVKDEAAATGVRYLSFGTSTESSGTVLNEGLLWQKESYGARPITHDFMEGTL